MISGALLSYLVIWWSMSPLIYSRSRKLNFEGESGSGLTVSNSKKEDRFPLVKWEYSWNWSILINFLTSLYRVLTSLLELRSRSLWRSNSSRYALLAPSILRSASLYTYKVIFEVCFTSISFYYSMRLALNCASFLMNFGSSSAGVRNIEEFFWC